MKISSLDAAIAATRALGHPARMRTAAMLRSGELCLCQITEVLGLAPSTVSLHIKELKRAGLVNERKNGRWVYFSLADDEHARRWIEPAMAAVEGDPELKRDAHRITDLRRLPMADLCSLGYEAAKAKFEQEG
jgi:arsenate reductase/ArsR family transcriptional regulator